MDMENPTQTPARRGRPPASTEAQASETATPKRRRRASVGGHALKLSAPPRPGFHRRWFNDDKNRIQTAQDLAYDFVNEEGVRTDDPSTRIRHLVGTKETGEPMYAYLMETPSEQYAEGVEEKERHNRQVDDAIIGGRDSTGQLAGSEIYGHGSIRSDR